MTSLTSVVTNPTVTSTINDFSVNLVDWVTKLQERVAGLETRLAALEAPAKAPDTIKACVSHNCRYYRDYLPQGAPDITHAEYHALKASFVLHLNDCRRDGATVACEICAKFERRLWQ